MSIVEENFSSAFSRDVSRPIWNEVKRAGEIKGIFGPLLHARILLKLCSSGSFFFAYTVIKVTLRRNSWENGSGPVRDEQGYPTIFARNKDETSARFREYVINERRRWEQPAARFSRMNRDREFCDLSKSSSIPKNLPFLEFHILRNSEGYETKREENNNPRKW